MFGVVGPVVDVEDPVRRQVEAVERVAQELVAIEGVAHRAAHAHVGEERIPLEVPRQRRDDPQRPERLDAHAPELVVVGLGRELLRRELHLVELALLEEEQRHVGVGQDLEHQTLEPRLGERIVLPALDHDLVVGLPLDEAGRRRFRPRGRARGGTRTCCRAASGPCGAPRGCRTRASRSPGTDMSRSRVAITSRCTYWTVWSSSARTDARRDAARL